jgi:anti-sigma factor RsiW
VRAGPEDLSAYVDGALNRIQRARVADAVAASAHLAAMLTTYQVQSATLKQIRSDVLREPIPPRLLEALRGGRRPPRRR